MFSLSVFQIFKNKTKVWMVLDDLSLTYYKNNKVRRKSGHREPGMVMKISVNFNDQDHL